MLCYIFCFLALFHHKYLNHFKNFVHKKINCSLGQYQDISNIVDDFSTFFLHSSKYDTCQGENSAFLKNLMTVILIFRIFSFNLLCTRLSEVLFSQYYFR